MAMIAMCLPILPGKKDMWLEKMKTVIEGPMASQFQQNRKDAGVHERIYLQETPGGDFMILTFEGENPAEGFGKLMAKMDDDFVAFVKEVHGIDPDAGPMPLPTLILDSEAL